MQLEMTLYDVSKKHDLPDLIEVWIRGEWCEVYFLKSSYLDEYNVLHCLDQKIVFGWVESDGDHFEIYPYLKVFEFRFYSVNELENDSL
jgi:hypothetical protein